MTWTSADMYTEGLTFFTAVVDGVPADRWDEPSPCDGWTARDVLGHVGEATEMGARILHGDDISFTRHDPPGSVVGPEPVEWWADLAAAARSAVAAVEDLNREVDGPRGRRTIREGLSFPAVDLFLHGWDLAAGTGQVVTFPDAAISFVRAMFEQIPEEISRSSGVFGPALREPDGATPTESLLAWTGRDPRWRPVA